MLVLDLIKIIARSRVTVGYFSADADVEAESIAAIECSCRRLVNFSVHMQQSDRKLR